MTQFTQLDLQLDPARTGTANLFKADRPESDSIEMTRRLYRRRLNRIINKATHRASTDAGRIGGAIFTK